MNWKDLKNSIEKYFDENYKEFYKDYQTDIKGLEKPGDIFKFIRNICSNDKSRNHLKNIYLEIYEKIKQNEELYLKDSTTIENLIIGNKYNKREICALADFWNTHAGILYHEPEEDELENVFITINREYKYKMKNDKKTVNNEINKKTIKYYAHTDSKCCKDALSVYKEKSNQKILNSDGLNGFIYAFKKINKNNYEYLGEYVCKNINIEKESFQDDLNLKTSKNSNENSSILFFNLLKTYKKDKDQKNQEEIQKNEIFNELKNIKVINALSKEAKLYKDRKALVKVRLLQGKWRRMLLEIYDKKCALTEIGENELLIASHVKPYSDCKLEEAVDLNNGIILNALMDKLFDKGFITFDNSGKIKFSKKLEGSSDLDKIQKHIKHLELKNYNSEMDKYMNYHRECIFKDSKKN